MRGVVDRLLRLVPETTEDRPGLAPAVSSSEELSSSMERLDPAMAGGREVYARSKTEFSGTKERSGSILFLGWYPPQSKLSRLPADVSRSIPLVVRLE